MYFTDNLIFRWFIKHSGYFVAKQQGLWKDTWFTQESNKNACRDNYYIVKLYNSLSTMVSQSASRRTLGPLNVLEEIKDPY